MKPLVLALAARPPQRLDLSPLIPDRLAGKRAGEILSIELQTTRERVTVGDIFRLRMGEAAEMRIEGACDLLDRIGEAMTAGTILVHGDVGAQAGRLMSGGRLVIEGTTGPWAGSAMSGGLLEVGGATGDRLGGPLAGETRGMRGGVIVVGGDAGERAGDRLRRGTIIVEGAAGHFAGSRMIAGTLIVCRRAGSHPGYLMRRGTIVLGEEPDALSPTFVDCGVTDLVASRLLAVFVASYSRPAARVFARRLRRFAGDMAVLGKGETFIAVAR